MPVSALTAIVYFFHSAYPMMTVFREHIAITASAHGFPTAEMIANAWKMNVVTMDCAFPLSAPMMICVRRHGTAGAEHAGPLSCVPKTFTAHGSEPGQHA